MNATKKILRTKNTTVFYRVPRQTYIVSCKKLQKKNELLFVKTNIFYCTRMVFKIQILTFLLKYKPVLLVRC